MIIRAISLWQPWADAMRVCAKINETRSWPTTYRGYLAIHAAKKPIAAAIKESFGCVDQGFINFAEHQVGDLSKLDLGAVIAIVYLSDCRPTEAMRDAITEDEASWGNYENGRWVWVTDPTRLIDLPKAIPTTGRQGLFAWKVPDELRGLLAA